LCTRGTAPYSASARTSGTCGSPNSMRVLPARNNAASGDHACNAAGAPPPSALQHRSAAPLHDKSARFSRQERKKACARVYSCHDAPSALCRRRAAACVSNTKPQLIARALRGCRRCPHCCHRCA
jgi:hypothetical protein